MSEKDLKPCPFCGQSVRFVYDIDGMPNGIWCLSCHMKVIYSDLVTNAHTTAGGLMEQLLNHWNKREGG